MQPKICAFQPHRYSRTKLLQDEFGAAFDSADKLYFTDIYSAGEKPIKGVDGRLLPGKVKEHIPEKEICYAPDLQALVRELYEDARPGCETGRHDFYHGRRKYLSGGRSADSVNSGKRTG